MPDLTSDPDTGGFAPLSCGDEPDRPRTRLKRAAHAFAGWLERNAFRLRAWSDT